MTTTADGAAARRSRASSSARGPARAAAAEQLSRADRVARGKDARAVAALESHAEFSPRAGRTGNWQCNGPRRGVAGFQAWCYQTAVS